MKKILALMLALIMCMSLVACGGGSDDASGDDFKITLKLSHVFAPNEQLTISVQQVCDNVYERTGGAVEIQHYPQSQLAVYKDNMQQVVDGSQWIACEDPSYLGDYNKDFAALMAPMLYTDMRQYSYVCDSQLIKDMCQQVEDDYGIHVLALDMNLGFRSMTTNKEIYTPDDLKGMKIRVPNSPIYVNALTAMGATPVAMGFGETISAVQQGVVDGLEGNLNAYSTNGSAEVAKVMSFTNHIIGTCGAYINIEVWNSIPEEYRNIIQEEFDNACAEMNDIAERDFDSIKADLESKGIKFNDIDVDSFKPVMEKEYQRMEAEDGVSAGFIAKLQALVAEYEAQK